MLSTSFALLLAATGTVAQTWTTCNPLEKTCPDDAGLAASTYTHDFKTGADNDNWKITNGNVQYTSNGAEFTVAKAGDSPTIQSNWYMFFGRVSFFLKAAPGTGIVSSAILESDDLDEIDWEWLGGADYVSKTSLNYFGKGNTTSYDRASWAGVANTQSVTHNYTITWTAAATTWYIDSVPVRTLNYADAVGGKNYPQTPMNIRVGIWAGGDPANAKGTIEWAGGVTDYSAGPYTMVLEKVEVVNDNPAKSYKYGDMSGSYESIVVDGAAGVVQKGQSDMTTSPQASPSPSTQPSTSASQPSSSSGPSSSSEPASSSKPSSSSEPAPTSSAATESSKAASTATGLSTLAQIQTSVVTRVTASSTPSPSGSARPSTQPVETSSLAPALSLGLGHYSFLGLLVVLAVVR